MAALSENVSSVQWNLRTTFVTVLEKIDVCVERTKKVAHQIFSLFMDLIVNPAIFLIKTKIIVPISDRLAYRKKLAAHHENHKIMMAKVNELKEQRRLMGPAAVNLKETAQPEPGQETEAPYLRYEQAERASEEIYQGLKRAFEDPTITESLSREELEDLKRRFVATSEIRQARIDKRERLQENVRETMELYHEMDRQRSSFARL